MTFKGAGVRRRFKGRALRTTGPNVILNRVQLLRETGQCPGGASSVCRGGTGYATEAARAVLWKSFTEMGVRRVVATTYEENLASRRVMEKTGMRLARVFRYTPQDAEQADTFHAGSTALWEGCDVEYTLEKSEWERREAVEPCALLPRAARDITRPPLTGPARGARARLI